jgi:hypothetical protein
MYLGDEPRVMYCFAFSVEQLELLTRAIILALQHEHPFDAGEESALQILARDFYKAPEADE